MENSTEFGKVISASSRFKPKETIIFDKLIIGPSGAKLKAYEWKYEWAIDEDKKEGGIKDVRVSDWTQAQQSADTGRGIVHQFTIEMPNREIKTVSSESVLNLLGYTDKTPMNSFPSLVSAVKTLAKQQMQLSLLEVQKNQYDDAIYFYTKSEKPEIVLQPEEHWSFVQKRRALNEEVPSCTRFEMGNTIYDQDNIYNTYSGKYTSVLIPTTETIKNITEDWIKKQVDLQGIKNPSIDICDLKNRIKRQQRKIDQILNK